MKRRSLFENPWLGPILLVVTLIVAFISYKILDSHDWPETMGSVLSAEVIEDHVHDHDTGFHGRLYSVVVDYTYTINGASYFGHEAAKIFSDKDAAEAFLKQQYTKDQKVPVLYNPTIPQLSSLKRASL